MVKLEGHSTVVYNNSMFIFGGIDHSTGLLSNITWEVKLNELLDSETREYPSEIVMRVVKTFGSVPPPRCFHACALSGSMMLVIGGDTGDNTVTLNRRCNTLQQNHAVNRYQYDSMDDDVISNDSEDGDDASSVVMDNAKRDVLGNIHTIEADRMHRRDSRYTQSTSRRRHMRRVQKGLVLYYLNLDTFEWSRKHLAYTDDGLMDSRASMDVTMALSAVKKRVHATLVINMDSIFYFGGTPAESRLNDSVSHPYDRNTACRNTYRIMKISGNTVSFISGNAETPAIWGHTAISANRDIIFFGGVDPLGTMHNALNIFTLEHNGEKTRYHLNRPHRMEKHRTGKWKKEEVPPPKLLHTAVVKNNTMIVFGGLSSTVYTTPETSCSDCSITEHLPFPRNGSRSRPSGVLSAAGYDSVIQVNDTWKYNMDTRQWEQYQSWSPNPRSGHTANIVNSNMIVVGGLEIPEIVLPAVTSNRQKEMEGTSYTINMPLDSTIAVLDTDNDTWFQKEIVTNVTLTEAMGHQEVTSHDDHTDLADPLLFSRHDNGNVKGIVGSYGAPMVEALSLPLIYHAALNRYSNVYAREVPDSSLVASNNNNTRVTGLSDDVRQSRIFRGSRSLSSRTHAPASSSRNDNYTHQTNKSKSPSVNVYIEENCNQYNSVQRLKTEGRESNMGCDNYQDGSAGAIESLMDRVLDYNNVGVESLWGSDGELTSLLEDDKLTSVIDRVIEKTPIDWINGSYSDIGIRMSNDNRGQEENHTFVGTSSAVTHVDNDSKPLESIDLASKEHTMLLSQTSSSTNVPTSCTNVGLNPLSSVNPSALIVPPGILQHIAYQKFYKQNMPQRSEDSKKSVERAAALIKSRLSHKESLEVAQQSLVPAMTTGAKDYSDLQTKFSSNTVGNVQSKSSSPSISQHPPSAPIKSSDINISKGVRARPSKRPWCHQSTSRVLRCPSGAQELHSSSSEYNSEDSDVRLRYVITKDKSNVSENSCKGLGGEAKYVLTSPIPIPIVSVGDGLPSSTFVNSVRGHKQQLWSSKEQVTRPHPSRQPNYSARRCMGESDYNNNSVINNFSTSLSPNRQIDIIFKNTESILPKASHQKYNIEENRASQSPRMSEYYYNKEGIMRKLSPNLTLEHDERRKKRETYINVQTGKVGQDDNVHSYYGGSLPRSKKAQDAYRRALAATRPRRQLFTV